jgi:hypothetical protein
MRHYDQAWMAVADKFQSAPSHLGEPDVFAAGVLSFVAWDLYEIEEFNQMPAWVAIQKTLSISSEIALKGSIGDAPLSHMGVFIRFSWNG